MLTSASFATERIRSVSRILLIDIFKNGISIGYRHPHSTHASLKSEDVTLKITAGLGRDNRTRDRRFFHGNPTALLKTFLHHSPCNADHQHSAVVLGSLSDPFFPRNTKFDLALEAIEVLAECQPPLIWVQTRSPLIILASPIFRALQGKVAVTLALENNSDELSRHFTPRLPRPSERLNAVKALRQLGVPVTLQAAPWFLPRANREQLQEFAEVLSSNADFLRVLPFSKVLSQQQRNKAKGTNHVESYQLLEHALNSLAPEKMHEMLQVTEDLADDRVAA